MAEEKVATKMSREEIAFRLQRLAILGVILISLAFILSSFSYCALKNEQRLEALKTGVDPYYVRVMMDGRTTTCIDDSILMRVLTGKTQDPSRLPQSPNQNNINKSQEIQPGTVK